MGIRLAVSLVIMAAVSAGATLDLKARHPDEPAEYTFNERFSLKNALSTTKQIRESLESFKTMTLLTKGKLSGEQLKEIGHTEWDIQYLGFPNYTGAIEGTLLKQEYLIKKLEYELAVERAKSGKGGVAVEAAKKEAEHAEAAFQKYWNSFGVAD